MKLLLYGNEFQTEIEYVLPEVLPNNHNRTLLKSNHMYTYGLNTYNNLA